VVVRAVSFLLLADSRASFEIEGEKPPRGRLDRWGRAVLQVGKNPLALDEIVRLHTALIEDMRFTRAGLRPDGVFLGERDHEGDPLPEFIGARPQDLQSLMQGMIAANERMRKGELDSVLQTAERVLVHVDTELAAKDLLNSRMAYVSISRGQFDAQIFTDNREQLPQALGHDVSHQSAYKPEQAVALPQPKIVTPKHDVELSMGFGLSL